MLNWLRAGAAIAVALVVVLVVVSLAGNANRIHRIDSSDVERVSVTKRIIVAPQAFGNAAQQPAAAPAPAPTGSPLQIARTGKVSLYVGNLDSAIRSVTGLAQRQGGDVLSMDAGNDDGSVPSAQMQIRIPADRFDYAMNGAGAIGKVRERSIAAEDLTSNITDSAARLRNLRRTEEDIRAIMDRSGSVAQVLSAEEQLSQVREQIETLESELRDMRGRVSYATIDVSMELEAPPVPAEPGAASQIQQAWTNALHALVETGISLAALVVWLVVFLPAIALCGAIAASLYVFVKRRQASRSMA